jgi:hypothetical protein
MTSCLCGRQWTGLAQAHCPTCHEHFGSVHGFDQHRRSGHCQHPATVTHRNGRPWFKAKPGRYGITWTRDNPDGHYRARDKAS